MKNFVVVDKDTGKAIRTGCCPDDMVELQANGINERVIEGKADDLEHKVVCEMVVEKGEL